MLGAGSWGTALAIQLGRAGQDVALWGRDAALIEEMSGRRANPTNLPDVTFPLSLEPVAALDEALSGAQHFEEALELLLTLVQRDKKGVGQQARELMIQIFQALPSDSDLATSYRRKLSQAMY